ncbi:prepilin peptidase [Micromonospora sp. NPDC048930]|uniref:prepilin peptidase n=1 Tax=Micromonospora sp. NPDC048930 TaxID=3364261 RepID=UPI003710FC53
MTVERAHGAPPEATARPSAGPWRRLWHVTRPRLVRLLAVLAVVPPARLAVARYAVPAGSADRAGCDRCGTPIGLDRPLPALGPAARCPACRARIGAAPGLVELVLVAAAAVPVLAAGPVAVRAAVAWWLAWAVPAALVDAAVHRLPDRLTWPAAAGAWALLGTAALAGAGSAPWLRATAAGLVLGAGFAATTLLLGRRGFGLGDAKLALGVGALLGWYGWSALVTGLVLSLALSALVGLALLAARRVRWSSHLPFGPFLIAATALTLLLPTP